MPFTSLTFEGLAGDGPNEYHALEIKLDKPGLKALTRTGYYAQPYDRSHGHRQARIGIIGDFNGNNPTHVATNERDSARGRSAG